MEVISIDKETVNNINLLQLKPYIPYNSESKYFFLDAGKEHYKLLAFFSNYISSDTIVDVGTNFGHSALALSHNSKKTVITYDIFDHIDDFNTHKANITFKIMDVMDDMETLLQTDLICISMESHDCILERMLYNHLAKYKYKGLLLIDHIHINNSMKQFWNNIPLTKHDLTAFGHWSGSGLVIFDDSKYDIQLV